MFFKSLLRVFITGTIIVDVTSKNICALGCGAKHRTLPTIPVGEFSCSPAFDVFTSNVKFPTTFCYLLQ